MNYITILDFSVGQVFSYPITKKIKSTEDYQNFLISMGFNLGNIEWMVSKNPKIITGISKSNYLKYTS